MTRVLVVDDAQTVRLYHRELLEQDGFQVEEAVNGLEALERLADTPYDLLLVDVNMPRMDGYTLVRRVREDSSDPGVPVIMVTTEGAATDREQALRAGANLHVVKPVQPEALLFQVRLMSGALS
ncbi:response regulator [Aquisalimonas sp. 2447]|uniref:response regulator n=1 Tax=Aquisalimonas sp. 2447 TaxID=2740807 RepID=UPI001432437D|nr:response regulator [Aquisalimonas sp. 2447]QIT55665.1 response regulator [Aquisalimonas sp. 2447]